MRLASAAGRIAGICLVASVAGAATGVARAQLPPPQPLGGRATAPAGSAAAPAASPAAEPAVQPARPRPWRDRPLLRSAYRRAIAAPGAASFVNGDQVYAFEPNRIYRLDASPRFLTVIALRPGEKLISKAAGDTVRWVIGETAGGGAGGLPQTLVLIKPLQGALRTNIVLTTDQRVYLIDAVSHEEPIFTSMVSWSYPADEMRELQQARAVQTVQALARQANVVDARLNLSRLNFDYDIRPAGAAAGGLFRSARPPRWMPVRVFDDGAKTYIEFPRSLAASEAPPLFLLGQHGAAELVNYRFANGYYVVDRLFGVAELRLGERPQTIVRITATGPRSTLQ